MKPSHLGRRGFLGLFAAAPFAAKAAANGLEEAAFLSEIDGYGMSAGRRIAGETLHALSGEEGRWSAESADALKLIARLGGSRNAPPELMVHLTPADVARMAQIDRRARRLERLKSMSAAAREAYASGEIA